MRRIAAIVLAGSLMATSAFAGDTGLQPGKPAGVQKAQLSTDLPTLFFAGLMTAIVVTIAVASANESTPVVSGSTSTTPPTTTTTTTTTATTTTA